jgi:hypothetical protein
VKEERGKRKEERGKRKEERGKRKEERGKQNRVLRAVKRYFLAQRSHKVFAAATGRRRCISLSTQHLVLSTVLALPASK